MTNVQNDDSAEWNTDDDLYFEIDNFQSSPKSSSPVVTSSDHMFATLVDMGFSDDVIDRAIQENGPNAETSAIIDTISKYSMNCEPSSSKSKTIDHFLAMGFDEEKIIKAIHKHGEENMEEIANALLSSEADTLPIMKEEDNMDWSDSDDEMKYADLLSSDNEKDQDSFDSCNPLSSLVKMGFSELEASLAIERCGDSVSIADLADFICAAHIAREFDEFHIDPEEQKALPHTRKWWPAWDTRTKLNCILTVDTVAYHLSVLKPLFPDGINVLSLFTGIGGGEVALHRLKIPMKTVISVEISEVNRNILRDFWEQTNQRGVLIEFEDVQDLTRDKIIELMKRFGGFDLVIGGSPCNNLAGGNRVNRSGLEGEQSSLFFEYCRILEVVRETTMEMRRS
ncbi:hypothetical protein HID58_004370 [Brassica napus]|uniref:DNA (cytosine-5-)-methyltransferase n=1 Tax=Brassica napus TaxID=3708 RepID=A0ABQ8E5M7_BRANA|nr:hypothetical protein HID58_004370 [Brassica napus]